MLFPPKILRMRIRTSIKHFYDDLKIFSDKMNWECTKPVLKKDTDTIDWSNNMVRFEEQSHYPNNSPKEIYITYAIPSFVNGPTNVNKMFENKTLPTIGYEHTISLTLPQQYPAQVTKTHIQAVTTLWHNNFNFMRGVKAHACLFISGEIDGMAMNIFQQLLWNPEFVWKSSRGSSFTLNGAAQSYARTNGQDYPFKALKHLMDQKFRL